MFSLFRRRRAKPSSAETLLFNSREIQIRRQPYKRSIGLTLQVNGNIRVSAPKTTPLSTIESFLAAHTHWIETHLLKYERLRSHYPPRHYVEGEAFPFVGRELALRYRFNDIAKPRLSIIGEEIVCELPRSRETSFAPTHSHPELQPLIANLYAREARRILTERLNLYAERMGLKPTSLSFRSQKTRWGSCSARGKITLNWRLAVAPLEVIDYVVVHELSHLAHYDHSKEFWALVASQIPDHATRRRWLRDHQYDGDFLAKRSELHV
jgi:predicted metal-dependent hydrolase